MYNTNKSFRTCAKVMYNTCTKALYFPRPVVFFLYMCLYIEGAGNCTGRCPECASYLTLMQVISFHILLEYSICMRGHPLYKGEFHLQ